MLKVVLNTDKGRAFLFGLSHANLDALRAGLPIIFDAKEVGVEGSKFIIMGGKTEEAMREQVMGLITSARRGAATEG